MKPFLHPEISVILLNDEDVIRTSGDEIETIPPVDDENQGEWT